MTHKMSRSWCFTFYYLDDSWSEWFQNLSVKSGITYLVMGDEICPSTKRPHLQGFIRWKNAKSAKAAKRWFGLDRIHVEIAKGNDFHNQTYCSKESLVLEIGEPTKQGKRTDISRAIALVEETNSVARVLEEVHNYQAVRHIELYLKYKEKERPVRRIEVIWIHGSSGKGKTRKVYDDNPSKKIFRPLSYKWWDGYDGHDIVLLDDLRRDYCSFEKLLSLLDIYPFRVECKGGSRQVQFTKIYITAPSSPEDMFGFCVEDIYQLQRRITQTINMDTFDI